MVVRVLPLVSILAVSACSGQPAPPPATVVPSTNATTGTSTTTTTTTTSTSATITAPTNNSGTASATGTPPRFPRMEDACTTADDCDVVHRDLHCCYVCGGMYGNKKWVTDVEAYCAGPGANASCPTVYGCERDTTSPMLGYGMSAPTCTAGRCGDK